MKNKWLITFYIFSLVVTFSIISCKETKPEDNTEEEQQISQSDDSNNESKNDDLSKMNNKDKEVLGEGEQNRENALIAINEKDYEKAIEYTNKAIENNPNDSMAYYIRGKALYEKGDLIASLNSINRAKTMEPRVKHDILYIGLYYYTNGEYEKSVQSFTSAISLDPREANAYYYRGKSYMALEKYNFGSKDFTNAIAYSTEYPSMRELHAKSYYFRGRCYQNLNNNELAQNDFTYYDKIK